MKATEKSTCIERPLTSRWPQNCTNLSVGINWSGFENFNGPLSFLTHVTLDLPSCLRRHDATCIDTKPHAVRKASCFNVLNLGRCHEQSALFTKQPYSFDLLSKLQITTRALELWNASLKLPSTKRKRRQASEDRRKRKRDWDGKDLLKGSGWGGGKFRALILLPLVKHTVVLCCHASSLLQIV